MPMNAPEVAVATPPKRYYKPRRPMPPPDEETTETMRQLRIAMRHAIGRRTIDQAAGLASCSTNTIARILRGDNTSIATAARIVSRLGAQMNISIDRKLQS